MKEQNNEKGDKSSQNAMLFVIDDKCVGAYNDLTSKMLHMFRTTRVVA